MTGTKGKIDQLQILRCIAAILVLFVHAIFRVDMTFEEGSRSFLGSFADLKHWGSVGVDLFFILSGFIMLYVTHSTMKCNNAQSRFLLKRFIRIVPIYYILTTLAVVLLVFAPELFNYREHADVPWIIASYLFIPKVSVDGVSQPVLGLGWTLNYEMYFYIVFSFFLYFKLDRAVILLSLFFIGSIVIGTLFPIDNLFYRQVTNWMLLEFLFGIWLAYFYVNNSLPRKTGLVAGLIGLLILLYTIFDVPIGGIDGTPGGFERMLWWGIPAALITYAGLILTPKPGRLSGVLVKLGNASYSIYLIQVFSLPALALIGSTIGLDQLMPKDGIILLFTLLSILIGYCFYLLVERPTGKWLTRTFIKEPA